MKAAGVPGGGPPDRVSFVEFQARNRRASWRLGAVCALVVGGGGALAAVGLLVNLALVAFALVFVPAVLLVGLGFLAAVGTATAGLREPLWDAATGLMHGFDLLGRLWPGDHPEILGALGGLLALGSWLAVRWVWLAAGVGEALLGLAAREPAFGDPEERQLVHVVAEMAVAAGVPPPRVRLLDPPVANAAAVGFTPEECCVVVGRRLLDELDRDATQGLLGHLIGAVGNGDLRGAAQIHALLYVLDLMLVVVLAPFARAPRRVARGWLAFPLWWPWRTAERRAAEARALIRLLQAHRRAIPADVGERGGAPTKEYFGPVGRVLIRVCPPLIALVAFAEAAMGLLLLGASAPVALLWRSRRYLADATAVQLTRNPDAVYRGLAHLAGGGTAVPGAEGLSPLFVVAPAPAGSARAGPGRSRRTLEEREGLLMSMHPPLARRLARLRRMGAVPPPEAA